MNEFPREINSAAIQILIEKENAARKAELEEDDVKVQLKKLEDQLQQIMVALKLPTK